MCKKQPRRAQLACAAVGCGEEFVMQHIVKRKGHTEPYDEKKVYASIFAACLSVREPTGSAELVADKVMNDVNQWIAKKHEVTANDIRRQASKHLHAYNEDAAHMLLHHRVVW